MSVSTVANGQSGDCSASWAISSDGGILRDGVHLASGYGFEIRCVSNVVYVLGIDNSWYRWTGGGWERVGPGDPGGTLLQPTSSGSSGSSESPGMSQPAPSGDCSASWAISSDGGILRDGMHLASGYGFEIRCVSNVVYVLGFDNNWYRWTGGAWTFVGATDPGGVSILPSSSGSSGSQPPTTAPGVLAFAPSPDHDSNVDSYYVEFRSTGPDGFTLVAGNIGKPAVSNGECRADITHLLQQVRQGYYPGVVAVLTAVNAFGRSADAVSAPFSW